MRGMFLPCWAFEAGDASEAYGAYESCEAYEAYEEYEAYITSEASAVQLRMSLVYETYEVFPIIIDDDRKFDV